MATRQWTTPTKRIKVTGTDLTRLKVWVTFSQGHRFEPITIEDALVEADGEDTIITVEMTQSQTAMFDTRAPLEIQVNYMDGSGHRWATKKVTEPVTENILRTELSYDDE